jgi:type I restriction-modification system DNA methylase subunit
MDKNKKLEKYYNYIVNDMVNQTTIDNENRLIILPFPPFFKVNPYSNEDSPIPMIEIKSRLTTSISGSGTLYKNMKDLYGLEDNNEIFKVLMVYVNTLVDKYTKFAEDYLNKVADDILNKVEKERNYLITPFGKFYVSNFRKNTMSYHDTSHYFRVFAERMGYTLPEERRYLFKVLSEKILNKFDNEN